MNHKKIVCAASVSVAVYALSAQAIDLSQVPAYIELRCHFHKEVKIVSMPKSYFEYCPDGTCDLLEAKKTVAVDILLDAGYLYMYYFSDYTELGWWRGSKRANVIAREILSKPQYAECSSTSQEKQVRCVVQSVMKNYGIALYFVRYDEGARGAGRLSFQPLRAKIQDNALREASGADTVMDSGCRKPESSGTASATSADNKQNSTDAGSSGSAESSNWIVSTLAGSKERGNSYGVGAPKDLNFPAGIAVDSNGNIYVADTHNNKIRKVTPNGTVRTLAGRLQGATDGMGASAKFNVPTGIALDNSGNVYVADSENHRIRKITPSGKVSTLAGGAKGYIDGVGGSAKFNTPWAVAVDGSGNVYVADTGNNRVRKITPDGKVSTLAGGKAGSADGKGESAEFSYPASITVDSNRVVYVVSKGIRKITPDGAVETVSIGRKIGLEEITSDGAGNFYASGDYKVYKITPDGTVKIIAGTGQDGNDDGVGASATFGERLQIAADGKGSVYIADTENGLIRKIVHKSMMSH